MADSGIVTGLVATAALAVAGVQAWIAHRKLKLDLFAKRFEAYESLNDAINTRQDELASRDPHEIDTGTSEALRNFWRQQRLMRVLFPPDVSESLNRIDEALLDYSLAKGDFTTFAIVGVTKDAQIIGERHKALMDAQRALFHAQEELAHRVAPYLQQYGQVEILLLNGRRLARRLWGAAARLYGSARRSRRERP